MITKIVVIFCIMLYFVGLMASLEKETNSNNESYTVNIIWPISWSLQFYFYMFGRMIKIK